MAREDNSDSFLSRIQVHFWPKLNLKPFKFIENLSCHIRISYLRKIFVLSYEPQEQLACLVALRWQLHGPFTKVLYIKIEEMQETM